MFCVKQAFSKLSMIFRMTTFEGVKRGGWEELHPDLLDEIAKHIPSYDDYVRVRAVCKSWNIALPKISRHITGPWLVLPFDDETFKMIKKKKKKKKAYHLRLRLPELQNTHIRGSCFGWLIGVGIDGELRILNPFTSSYFHLPPLSTFPDVVSYRPDKHGQEYTLRRVGQDIYTYTRDSIDMQKDYVLKVVLSSSPEEEEEEEEEDFMAVAIYGKCYSLAFCRAGDDKWTDVEALNMYVTGGYQDVIFHEGKIYAVYWRGRVHEFDVKTQSGRIIEAKLELPYTLFRYHKYLVRNPDGDLLLVARHWEYFSKTKVRKEKLYGYETVGFYVLKLDESTKRWWRVPSLGNYVLIVGYNSSIWKPSFADDEGNCARNCIYYTGENKRAYGHDIGVFSLKDRKFKQLFPNSGIPRPDPKHCPVWLLRT